jgi:hypothetical protein
VVSPSRTFRTDVQLVHMPPKQMRGRFSSIANQMSPSASRFEAKNEVIELVYRRCALQGPLLAMPLGTLPP